MNNFFILIFLLIGTRICGQTDTVKYYRCLQPESQIVDNVRALSIVEQMPKFPGGDMERSKFIKRNLQYPDNYDKWKGTIYVCYIIDTLGKIRNPCILRGQSNSPLLTENEKAAIKTINKMPQWEPGVQNKHKVYVTSFDSVIFTGK